MSTIANPSPLSLRNTKNAAPAERSPENARGLSVLLLAAVVAAMVVLADRMISTWADGHLLLAWVFLWVVVFAGMALFASTARSLAGRTLRSLDGWSQAVAQARADARLWSIAQSDPRLMQELQQALTRDRAEDETQVLSARAVAHDFDAALAPLGMESDIRETTSAAKTEGTWGGFIDRLVEQRSRNIHLYYI